MVFSLFGIGGIGFVVEGADAEFERFLPAGLDAAAAVEAVAGGDAARFLEAGKADHLRFRADVQTVAAAVAGVVVIALPVVASG